MINTELNYFRNYIVNLLLKAGLLILLIAEVFLMIRDYPNIFRIQVYIDLILLLALSFFVLYRHKIRLWIKVSFIIWPLYLVMIVGLLERGFIATDKIYIVMIPVISSFLLSYKKAFIILLLYLITYLILGILITKGAITPNQTMSEINYFTWVYEAAILFLGGFVLLFIGHNYSKKLFETMVDLKEINTELLIHKDNLEKIVQMRTEEIAVTNNKLQLANDKLVERNKYINNQNQELSDTLIRLKNTQIQLMQSEKMAALGILTAGVAHEINNPLNYIMGAYNGLDRIFQKKTYHEEEDTIQILIDCLRNGVEKASKIVSGLNKFSHTSPSFDEDCVLHEIIDNCLVMLHNQIKYRITIEKNYDSSQVSFKGNVGNMHQVFLNLIGNAIQAIPDKGIIKIETQLNYNQVITTISDTGAGIDPENINKIFDPFFTTKEPGKGTGLGLYITYNIIQEHKGTLHFDSELQKGTQVTITFPI